MATGWSSGVLSRRSFMVKVRAHNSPITSMFKFTSRRFSTGRRITVLPVETGKVTIKTAQQRAKDGRGPIARKIDMALCKIWTDPLPIYTFLIRDTSRPNSHILVDTGETWRTGMPGYYPWWNPFFGREVIEEVAPHEEIGDRLLSLGVDPVTDLGKVILTHMHHDHAGGLDHFPRVPIYVTQVNYKHSKSFVGRVAGCIPSQWPLWFKPKFIEFKDGPIGPFETSHRVTEDGSVILVPTPGHVVGHLSVIVKSDDLTYFIAGDAAYCEENIRDEKTDGVTMAPLQMLKTTRKIKEFCLQQPTIVLCSHDPNNMTRLENNIVFGL